MKPPTMAIEDVRRILAAQDAKVRAAYEALDPALILLVPSASLRELAARSRAPKVEAVHVSVARHAVRG
jgi:hypothetical protein